MGTCSLTTAVAAGTNYTGAAGTVQTFSVGQGTASTPTIANVPTTGLTVGGSFTATVSTDGDGSTSLTSSTPSVCTVGANGLTVTYVGVGTCSLTAHVATGTNYGSADSSVLSFTISGASSSASPANRAIFFAANSSIVAPAGIAAIRAFARAAAESGVVSISVTGYASKSGPLAVNKVISRQRANAVAMILRRALSNLRVNGVRIVVVAGGVRTVAPTDAGNRLAILHATPTK